ncbi:pre-60S ribosomal particles component [Collariella sp. IMI 366227]|nr:pre-60S ribosomal particles component [Collariella sp. IMI 366227]
MAGTSAKKRSFNDGPKGRPVRPTKKQRQIAAYHSSSDEASSDEGAPIPVNLLDSDDEDLDNIEVDDGASSAPDSASDSDSQSDRAASSSTRKPKPTQKPKQQPFIAKDAPDSDPASSNDEDDSDLQDEADEFSDLEEGGSTSRTNTKSKRNDPLAFATSISKMLSSKLPTSRRADPIAVDAALEAKARKRLREQKRLATEKGRVRDVLVASTTRTLNMQTGEIEEVAEEGAESTGQLLAAERRLRKVAQRGVVKLFNAVRAAQVKATEAQRAAKKEGVVGVKRKEEKVTEMSRKGFGLDCE